MLLDYFCGKLKYLFLAIYVDVIAADFHYDISIASLNTFLEHMTGLTQAVNELRQISGSQIRHVYIKTALLEEFDTRLFF